MQLMVELIHIMTLILRQNSGLKLESVTQIVKETNVGKMKIRIIWLFEHA